MTRPAKPHKPRKLPARIRYGYPEQLRSLVAAVRDVQTHREMNAAEPPEVQDSWDRLKIAVLESERTLMKPRPQTFQKRI